MTFDPDFYWTANGASLATPGSEGPEQAAVLKELTLLVDELKELGPIQSVLDVGCGQGRLAAWLWEELPFAKYTGMDLGQAQLDGTFKIRPDGDFLLSRLQDFQPDRKWDLVIASEVLLHIPPADIETACNNLKAVTGQYLITVDWTQPLGQLPIAEWNWLHDYESLLQPDVEIQSGLQSIFLKRMG
jgi:SAM-dependent methyltransferase